MSGQLWTIGNPKTMKGAAQGYLTAVLHLAPHNLADPSRSVCPYATPACIAVCLNTAGRGGIIRKGESTNVIQEARKRRTLEFFADRQGFAARLLDDARRVARKAKREGLKVAFRLNGTSDLDWQRIAPDFVAQLAQLGSLYDYTKSWRKAARTGPGEPIDYTLSYTGEGGNPAACKQELQRGGKVAVVFAVKPSQPLPETFLGARVVDGDEHDLTFLRPPGIVIGLRAKGKARKASVESPFVVHLR